MVNVDKWLENLGLGQYQETFAKNNVDSSVLPDLLRDDLKDMGVVAVGDLRKLENAIRALSKQSAEQRDAIVETANTADVREIPRAERRQTSLMFCDLVDSTVLAERLDAEELNEIFKAFRNECLSVVHQMDVRDIRTVGDGLLINFGYPQAHEDDPRRAVSAGLSIIASISRLSEKYKDKGIELKVRIGIHTGLVVVEDIGSSQNPTTEIVGMPAHIAARIHNMAEPNTIAVSSVTNELVRSHYATEKLGMFELKGVRDPVAVYRILHETDVESLETTAPLVERELRLQIILKSWQETNEGSGRTVLIQGVAGIGKSRLIRAFKQHLKDNGLEPGIHYEKLECSCSSFHNQTPLHSFIDLFERASKIERKDSDLTKLSKFETILKAKELDLNEYVPLIAPLLSIPLTGNYNPVNLSPQAKELATRNAIINLINQLAGIHPVLLIVEDLHWIDPSTQLILDELVAQGPLSPVCTIFTFRTGTKFTHSWGARDHVNQITLDRLSKEGVKTLAKNVAGRELTPTVLAHIIDRTDGVPLYVEELTKMIVESGQLDNDDNGHQFGETSKDIEIPKTLDGSLTARLDMLGAAKLISQQASTLGRSFSYQLLDAVFENDQFLLNKGLDQLVDAEILYRQGQPPESKYYFKHSLIQDAAYKTLLRADRKKYHKKIAKVLEESFPETIDKTPELIAHHYLRAEHYSKAVEYWRQANLKARKLAANNEALAQIENALKYVGNIKDEKLRNRTKIQLLIEKGLTLTALRGYAAEEVQSTYDQAERLYEKSGEPSLLFPVLRGLQSYFLVKGPLSKASQMGERLLEFAKSTDDHTQTIEAHRRLGWCLFCMGHIDSACDHLERAISGYNTQQSEQHILLYGSDPAVVGYCNLALAKWLQNSEDDAVRAIEKSVELGRSINHPLSLAYALGLSAMLCQMQQNPSKAKLFALETIDLAKENFLPYWVAIGKCLQGWAISIQNSDDEGIDKLIEGIEAYQTTGAELFLPYLLALLAEVLNINGESERSLSKIDEAIAYAQRGDVHYFEAELYRLKAKVVLDLHQPVSDAAQLLQAAKKLARKQNAKWLQKRVEKDNSTLCNSSEISGFIAEDLKSIEKSDN